MKRDQSSGCTSCNSEERYLLHNIRRRGIFHRLCTSCVLKFHSGSFCPNCFEVYDGPPLNDYVKCLKCPSVSHSTCVSSEIAHRYVCPTCSNPSFSFFDVGEQCKRGKSLDGEPIMASGGRKLDLKAAKVLLAAAKIAVVSISRAVVTAKLEADRKVKEAAVARKRAREALEIASSIATKEKDKDKVVKGLMVSQVPVVEQKKKPKGNSAVAAALAAQKRIQTHFKAKDKPEGIPVGLNDVGARQKERWVQRPTKNGEERDNFKGSPTTVLGGQLLQNHVALEEKSRSLAYLQNHVIVEEKEKNPTVSDSSMAVHHRHSERSSVAEDRGKPKGFGDSDLVTQHPQSNKDASLSKTNSGVIFTGLTNTASLLS